MRPSRPRIHRGDLASSFALDPEGGCIGGEDVEHDSALGHLPLQYGSLRMRGLRGCCKLRDAPGDRASWLKIKCAKHGVFPIIGLHSRAGAIAALHLARREGKALAYAGRAGTGFAQKSGRELRHVFDPLATDRPPVKGAPPRPNSIWMRPELAAAIEYTAITGEGLLRHASFKGCSDRIAPRPAKSRSFRAARVSAMHRRDAARSAFLRAFRRPSCTTATGPLR
jgi:ATP dependent DNA ligase-like protein